MLPGGGRVRYGPFQWQRKEQWKGLLHFLQLTVGTSASGPQQGSKSQVASLGTVVTKLPPAAVLNLRVVDQYQSVGHLALGCTLRVNNLHHFLLIIIWNWAMFYFGKITGFPSLHLSMAHLWYMFMIIFRLYHSLHDSHIMFFENTVWFLKNK